jgi:hypothetical protein
MAETKFTLEARFIFFDGVTIAYIVQCRSIGSAEGAAEGDSTAFFRCFCLRFRHPFPVISHYYIFSRFPFSFKRMLVVFGPQLIKI